MIAAQMIGSVGVRQAEMAKHEMKFSCGKSARSNPEILLDIRGRKTIGEIGTSNDDPADGHSRDHHCSKTFCVLSHVRFRQFNADGEKTCSKDNSHNLKSDGIRCMSPSTWVKKAQKIWTHEYPKQCAKNNLIDEYLMMVSHERT
jgi:hypothetical protein